MKGKQNHQPRLSTGFCPRWTKFTFNAARIALLVTALLVAAGALVSCSSGSSQPTDTISRAESNATHYASMQELEERYGVQVTLIAVTAAGGMVDFRFKVIDVAKAKKVLQDEEKLPILIVDGSSVFLRPDPATLQDVKLESGLVYYILYSNAGNLIKPGTPVSVVFGDLQFEPIAAK